MKKLYTIDYGNSNPHLGEFEENELKSVSPLDQWLQARLLNADNADIVFSSVGRESYWFRTIKLRSMDFSAFRKEKSFLEMPVDYAMTLGTDRLYQAYALYQQKILSGECMGVVCVDAGTFTTIDLIDKQGFRGGFIYPGTQTFLNNYIKGEALPKLKAEAKHFASTLAIPTNTDDAILESLKSFQLGIYEHMSKLFNPDFILFTGCFGESHQTLWQSHNPGVKNAFSPHHIHTSLQYIYQKSLRL